MKKVLLVDDHEMIRDAISEFLIDNEFFNVTGQASNGEEALNKMDCNQFDLILTDINMPVMDGMEFIRHIKKKNPNQMILVLTMVADIVHIKRLIGMGVNGLVLKNSSKSELIEAIEEVFKGNFFYSKDVYDILINNISNIKSSKKTVYETQISNREKEVLKLMANDFSNREIAEKLFISIRTVETHKGNLLQKTGCKSVAGLVMYGIERGII